MTIADLEPTAIHSQWKFGQAALRYIVDWGKGLCSNAIDLERRHERVDNIITTLRNLWLKFAMILCAARPAAADRLTHWPGADGARLAELRPASSAHRYCRREHRLTGSLLQGR